MITAFFILLMIGVVGKLIGFAVRMSWGIIKVLFTIVFWPVILIGMVLSGLISLAIPILVIIGIVVLVRSLMGSSSISA